MSDETKAPPTPTDIVAAEIAKHPGLVPGAAQTLASVWGSLAQLPADQRAAEVVKRMDSPLAMKYKDPEYRPAVLENGQAPSELRQALQRNAGRLATGAVDTLAVKLSGQVAGKKPHEVARFVEGWLASRDSHDYLAVRPEIPAHERRLSDLLYQNFAQEMGHDRIAMLARDQNGQLRRLTDAQVVSMVGRTLRLPSTDPRVSGQPNSIQSRVEPTRAPNGQFQQSPAKKPPGRLAF